MINLASKFERITKDTNGRHMFTLCPHVAETGRPTRDGRFINLVDNPDRTVTLVLCGVCCNVVIGALVNESIQKTVTDGIKQAFERAKRDARND